ncbi:MAG: hypothetical protein IH845_03410 [Nanoarchaeota archaeon]|nr:hypothetical protein [Nanoarchaeota archaeon]
MEWIKKNLGKILKKGELNEIVKVSLVVSLVMIVFSFFSLFLLDTWTTGDNIIWDLAFAVIATGLILHKRLDKNSSWGIYIGMLATGVIYDFFRTVVLFLS